MDSDSELMIIASLREANIIKLCSAARMAGLRWKNGDPGTDKSGIIERLQNHPTIMRATYAALLRMDQSKPNPTPPMRPKPDLSSFLDDISEESKEAKPTADSLPAPIPYSPFKTPSKPLPELTDSWNALDDRVRKIEGAYIKLPDLINSAKVVQTTLETQFHSAINDLKADIAFLKLRTPTEIHIPSLPPITLDGSEHKSYKKLLQYLHINRRVILTGSAGTGKSMAVHNAAKHFNLPFYLQAPVTMDHQYLGHRDANGVFHETPTFQAYTKGGMLLWDEADAGLPDAMLAANPIFDGNGFATFGDGKMYPMHPDFLAVFNMNTDGNGATMEYAGRNRLDGATLARFGVRIHWGIDSDIEAKMALGNTAWHDVIKAVRAFMHDRSIVDVNATPRHTKTGAMLLASNLPRRDVLIDILKSGALSQAWNDIENLPAVRNFLRG